MTGEEVGDGELGGADRMEKVDVDGGVPRGCGWVAGEGGGGGVPEGGEGLEVRFGQLLAAVRTEKGRGEEGRMCTGS